MPYEKLYNITKEKPDKTNAEGYKFLQNSYKTLHV